MTDEHTLTSGDHPDELLSAHVDGELDPSSEAWVLDHLDRLLLVPSVGPES